MIVAHVGPPPRRIGGPAGYLNQLQSAASTDAHPRHDVRFPGPAAAPPRATKARTIGLLTRVRRKLFGPKFYRPSEDDLARTGGVIDRMMREIGDDVRAEAAPSRASALAAADVVFTHDSFSAEMALRERRSGQQVWMMCHGVTPMALYAAWSWAVPEADWRTLLEYTDVRSWVDWELDVWRRVDRFILPCPEAAESFRTIDARFADVLDRARFVLSGASAPHSPSSGADLTGPRNLTGRLGLYLGSPEPYRGFDALVAAAQALPADSNVVIAVAGPDPKKVPSHPAFRPLGRVADVARLLQSVDFLINVNRFSLFDLSTIEATESGTPLLLHAVGGNRAFERLGAGCLMLSDLAPATIAGGLQRMAALEPAALDELGRRSRACWEQQLTPRHMWEHHLAFYDDTGPSVA